MFTALTAVVFGIAIHLASTVVFDVVHFTLHALSRSRRPVLRALGDLHGVHHRFFDPDLVIHEDLMRANLTHHVIPEFLTQAGFSLTLLAFLPTAPVLVALAIQVGVFALIVRARGQDVNHRTISDLRAHRPGLFFCLPEYHALHHVFPDAHYASWLKLFDQLARTGTSLRGRRIAVVGRDGPFADELAAKLGEASGRPVERYASDFALGSGSREIDVLVLAEPASDAAVRSARLEAHIDAHTDRRVPAEVWAVDTRDAAGTPTAYSKCARRFYTDGRLIYRHIERAAQGGESTASDRANARKVLRSALRGFHYLPATPRRLPGFLRFYLARA